jgi:hypothetical protein
MKTFKKSFTAFAVKELGVILSLLGKLTIYLAIFSYLDIIELNPQIQVADGILALVGLGLYLMSFLTSDIYNFFKMRYEKSTKY